MTNPVIVLVVAVFFILSRYLETAQDVRYWGLISVAFLLGPAMLYTISIWIRDRKVDIDLSNRSDRIVPLLLSTLGAVFGSFILASKELDDTLVIVSYVLVSMLVMLTVVTIAWKISMHTATASALSTLAVLFLGLNYLWLFLVVLLIAWARVYLGEHTKAQVAAGALVGLLVTYASWLAFHV